ncbi:flagellar biosynthetic protein FliR [bacterium]|nr:flagellar biosynthetic protein FliR [bacterium]
MLDLLNLNLDKIEIWLLMLFRVASMIMVMPLYGFSYFPVVVRVGLAFVLTSVLFSVHVYDISIQVYPDLLSFFGIILHEIAVGLAIGMIGNFLFYGIQFAGHIIGHTMGFGIINVIDPQSETQIPLMAQLLYFLTLMLFLLANGHHFLLMAIDESFIRIPIGGAVFQSDVVESFARLSADIFVIGIKFGAPVLVAILVTEFALGIVARTVPQMNVWILGFPLKIGIGLLTTAFSLPYMVYMFGKVYANWQGNFIDFLMAFAGVS